MMDKPLSPFIDGTKVQYAIYSDTRCKATNANFWARVEYLDSGCWRPPLSVNAKGYVYVARGGRTGKRIRLHRLMWTLINGDPGDKLVLHRCNHRWCFNPDHLYLGSAADNTADMMRAGRGGNQYDTIY